MIVDSLRAELLAMRTHFVNRFVVRCQDALPDGQVMSAETEVKLRRDARALFNRLYPASDALIESEDQ